MSTSGQYVLVSEKVVLLNRKCSFGSILLCKEKQGKKKGRKGGKREDRDMVDVLLTKLPLRP